MNISEETIKAIEEMYSVTWFDEQGNDVHPTKATEILFGHLNEEDLSEVPYIGKSFKLPKKKEVTLDYLLSKLNTEKIYKNFSEKFNKIVKLNGITCYPTSYGIGVFVAFAFRESIKDIKAKIENALNEHGIEYTTQYSDAGWVFR